MKLSIIIVNYNVTMLLEECLTSLERYMAGFPYEIIVLDNASPDASWKSLIEKFPEVQFHALVENGGFSKANNKGVSLAKGEYILLLNPDTLLTDFNFPELLKFADSRPDMGCIGVRMINGENEFLPESKRSLPNLRNSFDKLFLRRGNSKTKNYYRGDIEEHDVAPVEVVTGAFLLAKKENYLKVGGLDEAYFMYGEDIDLCFSLLRIGLQNWYYGKQSIVHYKGESSVKDQVYLDRFYGAMRIFLKKYYKEKSPIEYAVLSAGLYLKHQMALIALKIKSSFR